MFQEQDRNRNNSMKPIPGLRDDYYRNGPTPAVFNEEYKNRCLFQNQNLNVTSDNNINFDNSINSIQQSNFKQDQFIKNKLIDSNIEEDTKINSYKSITLAIDSIDRDYNIYKNSFQFKVLFNPTSSGNSPYIEKKIENITAVNLRKIILPNYYKLSIVSDDSLSDAKNQSLSDDILAIYNEQNPLETDVLYEKTNNIVLIWYEQVNDILSIDFFDNDDTLLNEKVYSITIDTSGTPSVTSFKIYTMDTNSPLSIERYITMEIEEFKNIDDYSTDNYIGHSFGTLFHDGVKCDGKVCYMLCCNSHLVFPYTNLRNISSLTINLYDGTGNKLDDSIGKNFRVTNNKLNQYDSNGDVRYLSASKYIRHPLYVYSQFYMNIGVDFLEPNLNKIIFN